ncbi:efflux RND transporter periplasmic adaptor subunit [Undibacterium sp. Ji22W]|uniref:efflux RND transporter periplasmic adaptor subunit n=1 Tax=Undibacterium sp. Ji22W TaxID=3413038 RepID=UPI003BF2D687
MQTILRPSTPLKRLLLALTISNLVFSGASQAFQNNPTQININPQQMNRAGVKIEAALLAGDAVVSTSIANVKSPQTDKGMRLSGTVVAASSASYLLSATVAGIVQNVHVNPLQQVQAGNPIVTIHSPALLEMQREYLQLAIQAHLSQEKIQRDEALFKEGIIAQSRLQESRALALQAEVAASERYQSLRAAGLSDAAIKQSLKTKALSATTTISAKSKGIVLDLQVQLGQRIEAGMPIAKIAGDAPFWIEFQASRSQSNQIRTGDLLQIKDCGTAKVMAISPQMDTSNQSVLIRAQEVRDSKQSSCLRLNQFIEASHVGHQVIKNSYGVPASALVRSGDRHYVFVKNALGFEVIDVQVVAGPPNKIWLTGKFGTNPQIATQGITVLKGAWLGLGADTEAPAKAVVAASASATNTNGKK